MINSLIARIFTIFFLILTLMLMLVLVLLQFYSLHQMRPLLDSEQRQSVMLQKYVEAELDTHPASDVTWWCRLFLSIDQWAPPEQHFILATREGKVIGAQRNEMQIIHKFIGQSNNTDYPKKKKYCCMELVGPFSIREGDNHYQLYHIRLNFGAQSNFINLFFSHPFLLLIITLLISTPLLLWLSWSLDKPARKLRNAADEVACGNLFQHPE